MAVGEEEREGERSIMPKSEHLRTPPYLFFLNYFCSKFITTHIIYQTVYPVPIIVYAIFGYDKMKKNRGKK